MAAHKGRPAGARPVCQTCRRHSITVCLPSNPQPQIFDRYGIVIVNAIRYGYRGRGRQDDDTDFDVDTDNTPFIGVASQDKGKSVIAYYGIERHSSWIFTPLFRGNGINNIPQRQIFNRPGSFNVNR